jgi:single-strand DNA-binding protein
MANLNKVFLIGRLTQDLELRYTNSGSAVVDLRMAVNRMIPTKDGGEPREEVLYIDVTVWNRQAENCANFLRKGRQVHVEGYLKMDSWDDKTTGEKRTKIKVEADRVQFLDSNRRDEGGSGDDDGPPREREYRRPAAAAPASPRMASPAAGPGPASPRRPAPPPPSATDSDEDEDIPF